MCTVGYIVGCRRYVSSFVSSTLLQESSGAIACGSLGLPPAHSGKYQGRTYVMVT